MGSGIHRSDERTATGTIDAFNTGPERLSLRKEDLMIQIVTVYPGADGESRLLDVTTDQFAESSTILEKDQQDSIEALRLQ